MVLSVHFFLNNGFYDTNIKGIEMFISLFLRWIFYLGVPLFILLTGYLKRNKELSKDYYRSIKKILISYVIISILSILFRIFYLKEDIRKLEIIISIFNFSANGYSWYVEMYIGIFLLIPFLNILYDNLKTKKNKQYLIITLIIMTSLYPIINYIKINNIKLDIIPNWWNGLYPLLYYFIGCYINEYKIKINKKKGLLAFISIIIVETFITYLYSYNNLFDSNFFNGYSSLQTVILSTILFLLVYNIKTDNIRIIKIVSSVSLLSFDMYLFSYIVDKIVYGKLDNYFKTPIEYLKLYPLVIIIIFSCSYLLSYIKDFIFKRKNNHA